MRRPCTPRSRPGGASRSISSACSPMAWPCGGWASRPLSWRAATSMRSCGSTPTRSARPSRTSSRTRARSWSRPGRWPWPGSSATRPRRPAGQRFVAINSGANLNFDRLRYIAERADLGAGREALLAVEIPEQPGSFLQVLRCARPAQRDRVQLSLPGRRARAVVRRIWPERRPGERRGGDRAPEGGRLRRAGHERQRDGETARALHDRRRAVAAWPTSWCSGSSFRSGPARCWPSCRRSAAPGTSRCSITVTMVRTMAGCSPESRCPRAERELFLSHLQALGYPYTEETANPAYRSFLGA